MMLSAFRLVEGAGGQAAICLLSGMNPGTIIGTLKDVRHAHRKQPPQGASLVVFDDKKSLRLMSLSDLRTGDTLPCEDGFLLTLHDTSGKKYFLPVHADHKEATRALLRNNGHWLQGCSLLAYDENGPRFIQAGDLPVTTKSTRIRKRGLLQSTTRNPPKERGFGFVGALAP